MSRIYEALQRADRERQAAQGSGVGQFAEPAVVNDAEELVGQSDVDVIVLSTRPTNQGLLVFARVADEARPAQN